MDIRNLILSNIKMNNKLIPLQFSIAEKLTANHFAFVFDEVGCGKTIEAGIAIWEAIKKDAQNILIVAPSNLTFNWYNEMLSKFGFDFKIIEGTKNAIDLYFGGNEYSDVSEISNFCIVTYDSKKSENSNAALDRIRKMGILWDVLILDEGHESKNEQANRYQILKSYKAKNVLFLSATPIKNMKEDFDSEWKLVAEILQNGGVEVSRSAFSISAENILNFNLNYPVSRNFKEILLEEQDFKTRIIKEIPYKIAEDISFKAQHSHSGAEFDKKRGSIFLYNKIFLKEPELRKVYELYKKAQIDRSDVTSLCAFDLKLNALLNQVKSIIDNNSEDKIVIFCNQRAVVDYLKKVLVCVYDSKSVEGIHGETYHVEERKNRIFLLDKNDDEMNLKKIVILSHGIGSVGINLSKFNHLINYELPYTPADLEQRFGRIDRITNKNTTLSMYFFTDENGIYDEEYFKRIVKKLVHEVLPILPSKNLLFLSEKTQKVYKEFIFSLMELEDKLEECQSRTSNQEKINVLLPILKTNEFFKYSSQHFERGERSFEAAKLKTYDETQVNSFITNLTTFISDSKEIIFSNLGVEKETIEEIEKKIAQFVNNSITYKDGKDTINLNYNQLSERVFNEKYIQYKQTIELLDQEIEEIQKSLVVSYRENGIDGLIKWIRQQDLNDTIIFSVLYSIWRCLGKEFEELTFENLISAYNREGIIVNG